MSRDNSYWIPVAVPYHQLDTLIPESEFSYEYYSTRGRMHDVENKTYDRGRVLAANSDIPIQDHTVTP